MVVKESGKQKKAKDLDVRKTKDAEKVKGGRPLTPSGPTGWLKADKKSD